MRSALYPSLLALMCCCPCARAEWLATLYMGDSHTYASNLTVIQPQTHTDVDFDLVSWAPHPLGHGAPYYGVRLSYFPAAVSHVGAVFDFTHYKMYAETNETTKMRGEWNGKPIDTYTSLQTGITSLELAHGVNLVSLNGEYRWNPSFSDGPWQTHAGAGLVAYAPHADGIIDGVGVDETYQYGGLGGQIFGGAEYTLPARWQPNNLRVGLLVESKLDAGSVDLSLDPDTRIETRVTTLHLIGGISLHF
ncbi:MAG TPA: hypothetical protein VMU40_14960 [Steroidobacteraceae bacterium]|nr:hypothetical protein [Steroidobacteraceae bacterium]